jgi:integrase
VSIKLPVHGWAELHRSDQLTGHAFAERIKMHARWAGIGDIHLNQTRHTFARRVSESTGSIIETQDALGHKHTATTRVYVQRVAVKRDRHSTTILDRLDI